MSKTTRPKRSTETEIQTSKIGGTNTQGIDLFKHKTALLFSVYFTLIGLGALAMIGMGAEIWTLAFWGGGGDRSAVVRNLGLVAIGVIGMPFAIWRAMTAYGQSQAAIEQAAIFNRQVAITNKQAMTANRQADLTEKGLIIDRFQKGAQMLESKELAVRLAGIYALRELAKSDPADAYTMVLDLLFDFVREESKNRVTRDVSEYPPFPPDLQKALDVACFLRIRVPRAKDLERDVRWKPLLDQANLAGASLNGLNLSNASMIDADLQDVALYQANLECATLVRTNMSRAQLGGTNLLGAVFTNVNMFEAYIGSANFAHCHLNIVNLTSTRFLDPKLRDVNVTALWAYEGNPPIDLPEKFKDEVAYRATGETWEHFVLRIVKERAELGWNAAYMVVGGD